MNVLVFGASGDVGSRIARELLDRGHQVTGVSRSGSIDAVDGDDFEVAQGDATNPDDVADLARGHDAVVSAIGPADEGPDVLRESADGLVTGLREAGVSRVVVIGGGGTLEIEPGVDLVDTEDFPDEVRPASEAHRDALHQLQDEADDLEWTFLAPPIVLAPGERTGEYRTGTRELMFDEEGDSEISMEDLAVAVADELEEPSFVHEHMTVAY